MKKNLLFLLTLTLTINTVVIAAPKKVRVSNASDTTLKVCIYMSTTVDDIGQAVGEFKSLAAGASQSYEYNYTNGRFIHTVVFLPNDDKIITDTFQASQSDNREVTVNVTIPSPKPVDRPEIDRMNRLVDNEISNFSRTYKYCIRVEGDANSGIQEYLGAIAVIDTLNRDFRSSIKLIYSARQLGISENPPLSGRSFQESYKITKEFAGDAAVSVPTAFSYNIDFSNGDMQEVSLSCKAIGTVLFPTRAGITPIGLLLDFDDKSVENIVGTITETLNSCPTCILQQIQGIMAHSGIAVNVKRYRKSNIAFASSAASIVSANGIYNYENGFDYFDIIAPRVIALGFTDIDLRTNFSQTVLEKLKLQKKDLENLINNQQTAISTLRNQLKDVDELIGKLETF